MNTAHKHKINTRTGANEWGRWSTKNCASSWIWTILTTGIHTDQKVSLKMKQKFLGITQSKLWQQSGTGNKLSWLVGWYQSCISWYIVTSHNYVQDFPLLFNSSNICFLFFLFSYIKNSPLQRKCIMSIFFFFTICSRAVCHTLDKKKKKLKKTQKTQ